MKTQTRYGVTFFCKKTKNDTFAPQAHVEDLMKQNGHQVMIKYDNYEFASVQDHDELADLIVRTKAADRCYYEVLLADTPQYLFADIDGQFKDLESGNVIDYLNLVSSKLKMKIPDFDEDRLLILDSSTDQKLSLHLSYPIVFKDCIIQKRFWNDICHDEDSLLQSIYLRTDDTYEKRSVIDLAVYSRNRPMRTILSHKKVKKGVSPRTLLPKRLVGSSLVEIENPNISDYFICCPADEDFWDYQPIHDIPRGHLLTEEAIREIISKKVPGTEVREIKGGLFCLSNTGPRTCMLGGELNESDNCYVVWKRDGLYFGCLDSGCQGNLLKIFDITSDKGEVSPQSYAASLDDFFNAATFMAISYKMPIEGEDKNGNPCTIYVSTQKELDAKQAYFEQFVCFISDLNKVAIKTNPRNWTFHSVSGTKDMFSNCTYINIEGRSCWFFDYWRALVDRHEKSSVIWLPYTSSEPEVPPESLNIFCGLLHTYEPNFQVNMDLIDPWLYHLEQVWADGDQEVYRYLVNWFAYIIQRLEKPKVNIVIKSIREGTGKNILTDHICQHVLGPAFTRQFSDIDSFLGKFNASAERSLLTVLDEIGTKGGAFKNHNRIKDLTTRVLMPVERKGVDAYMAEDRNSNILTSNDDWIMKLGSSDRRNLCIEASSKHVDDTNYWSQLIAVSTLDAGKHLFHYLAQVDISKFNPRVVPMTEWKRLLLDLSMDPYFKTLVDLNQQGVDRIFSKDLMALYNRHAATKYSKGFTNVQSFNCSWMKYTNWEKRRILIGSTQKVGFAFESGMLLLTAQSVRKDPSFQFPVAETEQEEEENLPTDLPLV